MSKYNIYKSKYEALEIFYWYVDCGDTYELAVSQYFTDFRAQNDLDDIVNAIIIATRFTRVGKPLSTWFVSKLEKMIRNFSTLDLSTYELTEQELKKLRGEVNEVDLYIKSNHVVINETP